MDSRRFDAIARSAAIPATRRSALGALVAGGLLGAFGLGREEPALVAAQGGLCVLAFAATVRQGPNTSRPLVSGGAPGELRGYLRFALSGSGDLQNADLLLDDGSSLPVVGQATGHGFQARVDLGQGRAVVAVGVGEQDMSRCLGRLDGPATGPEVGDLGEWHATAGVQNLPAGSGGPGGSQNGGNRPAGGANGGGRANRGNRPNDGNQPSGGGSTGRGGQNSGGSSSGSSTGSNAPSCPPGETYCDDVRECRDLMTSPLDCGRCGVHCPSLVCRDGRCLSEEEADRGPCQPGETFCNLEDGYCADLQTNPLNCGRCGNVCSDGGECRNGSCGPAGSDSSGGSSTSAQTAQTCPSGQTRCGETCVDLQTDKVHCGECDHPCASELGAGTCIDGNCTCSPGTTRCDDVCVNTDLDPLNCGTCGNECSEVEECVDGACAPGEPVCQQGQTRCVDACVDTTSDPANCGTCGKTCAAGETCTGSECTPATTAAATTLCPEGQVRCGGACQEALPNFGTEGISCPGGGAAPTECPAGRVLCNGACYPEGACQPTECQPGWGYCYGVCRDFQNDSGYCGGCSGGCTGGTFCSAGTCVSCPSGQTLCSAGCVDTKTDLNNCGFCGNLCGTQCIDGQCTGVGPSPVCVPGTTKCGNDCVDLTKNPAHCGACGVACPPNSYCAPPGTCTYCEPGLALCGDTCVDISSDINNCGACGYRCPPDSLGRAPGGCVTYQGRIVCAYPPISGPGAPNEQQTLAPADQQTLAPADETTCTPGLVDCSGVCTDVAADPLNCGSCFNACAADATCQGGQCSAPVTLDDTTTLVGEEPPAATCPDGLVDCGGSCADVFSDPLNCGSCGVVCGSGSSCDVGVCTGDPAAAAPAEGVAACAAAGETCDPASPGACCSGVCNDDGTCA